MIDRRKFLGQSVLSTGSVLFSSMVLGGCTKLEDLLPGHGPKHPPAIPPIIRPELESDIDWNDDAKILVTSTIEMIPVAGDILSGLVDIFWPDSTNDVWDGIKAQVEALIDQKLDANTYTTVSGNLTGLSNVAHNYLNAIHDKGDIKGKWEILTGAFALYQPNFQKPGDELLLLPLFGQFANMYLAILRDGALHGNDWGMAPGDVQQAATDLDTYIGQFYSYAANTYNTGRLAVAQNTKANYHLNEPFKSINQYDRQMTFTVLDFMNTWPYFSANTYPDGATPLLTREIYSDPFGTSDDSGNIVMPYPAPTQRPTSIAVWAGDRVQAVQSTYPQGSGPGGVTQTPRMGAGGGNYNVINIPVNIPIIAAGVTYGDVVNQLQFLFDDGTTTNTFGAIAGSNSAPWIGFPYEALSRVHINGTSEFYGSADTVVFGFQFWKSPKTMLKAIQTIYIKTPQERSLADFAKAFPNLSIPANLITNDLKAARDAYWKHIKAQAGG